MAKILIIRFSSIGDIVLTTPVIRCLKQQLPDCEVHYLTKKSFSPVLAENPYLDKVHSIEKKIEEVIVALRKENFDYIVDLHQNLRSKAVRLKLKKPGATFNKLNIKKWLVVNLKINLLPDIHIVDRYLNTVKSLGVINDNKGLDYFIPKAEHLDISNLPITHQNGYIGFVIGGQHATKRLPVEKIIAICKKVQKPVVLLGGREDRETARKVTAFIGKDKIYSACGKYNINQSASLVKQADKIITHDTGLMHIASAFKKDIVSIWGNTIPEFGMYPYMPGENSKIMEVKGLRCRPCSKLGYEKCPKKHFYCMNLQDETAIAEGL